MKILILPLFIILLPVTLLFLIIKYWKKGKHVSIVQKIVLGITFAALGFVLMYVAIIVSVHGHADRGIQCASGVIIFIPMSLFVNFIGIPLILFLERNIRGITRKSCE